MNLYTFIVYKATQSTMYVQLGEFPVILDSFINTTNTYAEVEGDCTQTVMKYS